MPELIWEGKFDKDGRRVAPLRLALPFQTVETVNESAQERQRTLDFFRTGRDPEWRNRLIWGEKKYVLPSLLPEFAGKVDLIYIDPPFDTGADFSFRVQVDGEDFTKEPSVIEQKAYRDTWGRGTDSYLEWLYEAVTVLRELLSGIGSLYVHLDWHVAHYAKLLLDEVFGSEWFQNEIVWHYSGWNKRLQGHFERRHDNIFFYSKGSSSTFNSYSEEWQNVEQYLAIRKQKLYRDPDGSEYTLDTRDGGKRVRKIYLNDALARGRVVDSVWGLDKVNNSSRESMSYDTQKPEALLERIIRASSNPGDLVLDCFCGSGTTAVVAENLGRRWIAADLGRFAIHTTRKRLLSVPDVRPFVVQNLGKYERQVWQAAEFGDQAEARQLAYRRFILDLFNARPIEGYAWLHGLRGGRMVHVGSVDSPVSPGDVTQIAAEFRRSVGTGSDAPSVNGVDVLGWDFAFELNEVAKQQAALAGIHVRFVRIPREVLEKRAVEQGDIRFFELAALSIETAVKGRAVTLSLTDFVIPLDDVPEDVQRAIRNWAQWIDYWAVDWDNKGDTFHNEWQTYRTRQNRDLQKSVSHTYPAPGYYTVVAKVIDILGNDTTKTLRVEVA